MQPLAKENTYVDPVAVPNFYCSVSSVMGKLDLVTTLSLLRHIFVLTVIKAIQRAVTASTR